MEVVIRRTGEDHEKFTFRVIVIDNSDWTQHDVSLSHDDYESFGLWSEAPEKLVDHCFVFLLKRCPKESIPSRFEVGRMADLLPSILAEPFRAE